MVVVTISMLDIQLPLEETHQEVRNVVLLQQEELVLSEVPERLSKRMTEEVKLAFSILTLELEETMQSGILQQHYMLLFVLDNSFLFD